MRVDATAGSVPTIPRGPSPWPTTSPEAAGGSGRSWVRSAGTALHGLHLLRPPPERNIAQSRFGGLAAAEVVEEELGLWRSAQIKWPNDVMVNRRKVAGVLAEAREGVVVLGIGINVNQTREQLPEMQSRRRRRSARSRGASTTGPHCWRRCSGA